MPSIREMFASGEIEDGVDGDLTFDMDMLLSETERAINESTRLRVPELEANETEGGETESVLSPLSNPVTPPAEEEDPGMGASDLSQGEEVPVVSNGTRPDPLALLPADRQAALLAMDRVFQEDPAKREAVLRALSSPTITPEPVYVEPELPPQIDPDSVEAMLWKQNVETQRQVAQMASATRAQQETFAKQQAATAAERAGSNFAARYDGKLTQDDVMAIARHAGQSGIAARFANGSDNLAQSFDQALEHVLWTNEPFRNKVLGVGDVAPVEVSKTPESKDRKRKLTALSSSASPVSGPGPAKTQLETRADGRLSEASRLSVVKEMASKLNRASNEGNF